MRLRERPSASATHLSIRPARGGAVSSWVASATMLAVEGEVALDNVDLVDLKGPSEFFHVPAHKGLSRSASRRCSRWRGCSAWRCGSPPRVHRASSFEAREPHGGTAHQSKSLSDGHHVVEWRGGNRCPESGLGCGGAGAGPARQPVEALS